MNRHVAIILAPVAALASCMTIKPDLPTPTITTLSVGLDGYSLPLHMQ